MVSQVLPDSGYRSLPQPDLCREAKGTEPFFTATPQPPERIPIQPLFCIGAPALSRSERCAGAFFGGLDSCSRPFLPRMVRELRVTSERRVVLRAAEIDANFPQTQHEHVGVDVLPWPVAGEQLFAARAASGARVGTDAPRSVSSEANGSALALGRPSRVLGGGQLAVRIAWVFFPRGDLYPACGE